MGGKSGGGARTPYEAPNTLQSAQRYKAVHVLAEGELAGFAGKTLLQSIYFNGTPIQDSVGNFNFRGVEVYALSGTANQPYVPGFDTSENTVSVGAEVKKAVPVTRTVTDPLISRLRVTVAVERNIQVQDNGDTLAATTDVRAELVNDRGVVTHAIPGRFSEKGSGAFHQDIVFERLPKVPFRIRVVRVSDDPRNDKTVNRTHFASYVEVIDVRQSHPHSALLCVKMDSAQFGSSVPTVNALVKGRKDIKIPSNYDPITRTYNGIWNGGDFKTGWTDNPAWILYDILTTPRFSTIARRLLPEEIDVSALYEIGRYCDEMVPDGRGGQEPRFSCNIQMLDAEPRKLATVVSDLCSAFLGMGVWTGSQFSALVDRDADPVYRYTNVNVVKGAFSYASTALKSVHTAVHVRYADADDFYRVKTEYVSDDKAIARYGLNIKQVEAFGCTSRTQALRVGRWMLKTSLMQQETVTFAVGREGLRHRPYDIIQIADSDYVGAKIGGRIVSASGRTLELDMPPSDDAVGAKLVFQTTDGSLKETSVVSVNGAKATLADASGAQVGGIWLLSGREQTTLWRAITITENASEGTYNITAVRHDPAKYAAVNTRPTTPAVRPTPLSRIYNIAVHAGGGKLEVVWQDTASGSAVGYDVVLYRNGVEVGKRMGLTEMSATFDQLQNGNYVVEITGTNERGVKSRAVRYGFSLNYNITGVKTTAKLLSIALDWTLPEPVVNECYTEVWYSKTNDINTAERLTTLPFPQTGHTLSGVGVTDRYYFWLRVADINGGYGEFTQSVEGRADDNPEPLVSQLQGSLTASSLSEELRKQLADNQTAKDAKALAEATKKAHDALAGKVAGQERALSTLQTSDAAQTAEVTAMKAELAGAKSSITEIRQAAAATDGRVRSMYSLRVASAGKKKAVVGFGLGADGNTGESEFNILANKLVFMLPDGTAVPALLVQQVNGKTTMALNGDLVATGSIHGKHIAASQTIQSPKLVGGEFIGGSLNLGNGRFTVSSEGLVSIRSALGKVGLNISNDQIVVRNEKEEVQVELGKLF